MAGAFAPADSTASSAIRVYRCELGGLYAWEGGIGKRTGLLHREMLQLRIESGRTNQRAAFAISSASRMRDFFDLFFGGIITVWE